MTITGRSARVRTSGVSPSTTQAIQPCTRCGTIRCRAPGARRMRQRVTVTNLPSSGPTTSISSAPMAVKTGGTGSTGRILASTWCSTTRRKRNVWNSRRGSTLRASVLNRISPRVAVPHCGSADASRRTFRARNLRTLTRDTTPPPSPNPTSTT